MPQRAADGGRDDNGQTGAEGDVDDVLCGKSGETKGRNENRDQDDATTDAEQSGQGAGQGAN